MQFTNYLQMFIINRKALISLQYTLKSLQFLIFARTTLNNLAAESWKVLLSTGILILLLLLTAKIADV